MNIKIRNIEFCTGCLTCEIVCSLVHTGEINPKKSFIRVVRNEKEEEYYPVINEHCDLCGGDPECVKACPQRVILIYERD